MEGFRVTREMAQELAETGAVQAPVGILPDCEQLKNLLGTPRMRAYTSGPIQYEEFQGTVLAKNLSPLISYANDLLSIAYVGLDVSWRRARVQTIPKKPDNLEFHRDGSGDLSGISFLVTHGENADERLITAGRGTYSTGRYRKEFKYRNGPIIIAQKGWGLPILQPGQDTGATWHCGMREKDSVVGIVDFLMH